MREVSTVIAKIQQKRDTESGFTLIELLVVILIIGVLASIAIPMFLNQRKAAADASLTSDLRNIATVYKTWQTKPGNTNAAFGQAVGGGLSVTADPAGTALPAVGLPEGRTSDGNTVEIVVAHKTNAIWTRTHDEGEFCLAGSGKGGNYNYPGGDVRKYNQVLFYDAAQGGVKTVEELAEAINAGEQVSCYGYAQRWKTAVGV